MAVPSSSLSRRVSPVPSISRSTPFDNLPDLLTRTEVRDFLGVPQSSADSTIRRLGHQKFGKHIRFSKRLLVPSLAATEADAGKPFRDAIQELIRSSKTPAKTKQFLLKELAKRGIPVRR